MTDSNLALPWRDPFRNTGASTFLVLLLAADFAFIFLHLLLLTPAASSPFLSLKRDHGYPEIYQYVKELWVVLLLAWIMMRSRTIGYAAWVLMFAYLLLDDALGIHEKLGHKLGALLGLPSLLEIRPADFGELAVSAGALGVCPSIR